MDKEKELRILMVWDGDYPWDVRVEKICRTLIENGHEVSLVSRNSKGLARRESVGGVRVRRVFAFSGFLSRLNPALTFPLFVSPLWLHEIRMAVKEVSPDLIIIRDLPIALAVLPFAKMKKIRTALDMAECYPEMIRCAWRFEKFNPVNIVVRNPFFADLVEKITIHNVDMIWVMIEESASRLLKKGVQKDKIKIVSNTPSLKDIPVSTKERGGDKKLQILYVGLINPSRGLRTLVDAADIVKKKFPDFQIKIVGSGKDFDEVKKRIERKALGETVIMTGWINQEELAPLYREADVGIVPHYQCSHWDNTIPNKIFDYMRAGIPVIVSSAIPACRVVRESGAGLTYDSFSAGQLAEKILELTDKEKRDLLGRRGRCAVRDRFNWESDSRVMLEAIGNLSQQ